LFSDDLPLIDLKSTLPLVESAILFRSGVFFTLGSKDLAKAGGTIKKGGKSVKQFYKSPVNRYTPAFLFSDDLPLIDLKSTLPLVESAILFRSGVFFTLIEKNSRFH
jgi:hypothetical protein